VLDRLADKGLIRRESVAGDRRSIKINLTGKGNQLFRRTFAAHVAFIRPFFERALTEKDADQLRDLLARIRDSFERSPAS
jgi:DNA-binding MarR family transcriptional regulator